MSHRWNEYWVPIRISVENRISMSQIIVCLKKYAKDSGMVYYFRLKFEVQIDAHSNG